MTQDEKNQLIAQFELFVNSLPSEPQPMCKNSHNGEKVELLTIKECTKIINGLSECTLRQLVTQGKISYIRTGAGKRGKILIPKEALLKYFSR